MTTTGPLTKNVKKYVTYHEVGHLLPLHSQANYEEIVMAFISQTEKTDILGMCSAFGVRSSVQFSSVQDGINALGKAHKRVTPLSGVSPLLPLKQFLCWSD